MRILLTNDDSHDSPLFHYTIEALSLIGDVDIVVPATEQSWKGKAMTRVGGLKVEDIDLFGTLGKSVTGTPADCVNLAIHNLLEHRPDVVVSGTNIGKNVGVGFPERVYLKKDDKRKVFLKQAKKNERHHTFQNTV